MTKKKNNKIDWRVIVTAIIALAAIEVFAMYHGINGTLRALIVGIIAALAGWSVPQLKTR